MSRPAPALTPGPLLEREHEVEQLRELWAAARGGEGSLLVVEGPAGIGKTRLLEELRAIARDGDAEVLTARGAELEREFGFGVVRQLLERRVSEAPAEQRRALLAGPAALGVRALEGTDELVEADPPATWATLHGLYRLLGNLARQRPVLVVVDDAHWADDPSLRFLAFVAHRLEDLPVLLAVGVRPGEPDAPERLDPLVLDPRAVLLRPAALSVDGIAGLVGNLLRTDLSRPFAETCHHATGGNPFLAGELGRELAASGASGASHEASRVAQLTPASVARAVLSRLERLGPDAVALARAVAVLGDGARLADAVRLAGIEGDRWQETVDALSRGAVLGGDVELGFTHPLVRAAVYAELPSAARMGLHLEAARLLRDTDRGGEAVAAQLLHAPPQGRAWAVEVLREAARSAVGRAAPGPAVVYLRRALEEPPPRELSWEVLHELGIASVLAGRPDAADRLREALASAPPGVGRATAARSLAQCLVPLGAFEEAVDALEAAIDQLPEKESELRLALEAVLVTAGRLSPATFERSEERLLRAASAISGATPGERPLLANLAMHALLSGGTADESALHGLRALDGGLLEEQTAASPMVADALYPLIVADHPAAAAVIEAGLQDAARRGSLVGHAIMLCFRAHLAWRGGDLPGAEADARESLALAREHRLAFAAMVASFLVDVLVDEGRAREAGEELRAAALDGALPNFFMANFLLAARARLALAEGDPQGALADLGELDRRAREWRAADPRAHSRLCLTAEALVQLGGSDLQARRVARAAREEAGRWGTPRAMGVALRTLALTVPGDERKRLLVAAVERLSIDSAPLERARSLLVLGSSLRQAGRREEAQGPLREALDLAGARQAASIADRARAELLIAGARPRRDRITGRDALTASELRVARMARDGKTNREIAKELCVALRTVETHLTHAYRKLGISARRELAEAFAETRSPTRL